MELNITIVEYCTQFVSLRQGILHIVEQVISLVKVCGVETNCIIDKRLVHAR